MRFAFSDEQEELRRTARRFLGACSTPARVRAAAETEAGFDREVWARASRDLGWSALVVPDAYGGAGLGPVELSVVMEEMGRALFCSPFFATVCLATNAIVAGGTEAQKARFLPPLVAGDRTATLAHEGGAAIARRDGNGFALDGGYRFVVDGHTAGTLLVAATGPSGPGLFVVDGADRGVSRAPLPTMDATRRLAEVHLAGARAEPLGGAGPCVLSRTLDVARVALAAEQVGTADRCLEMSLAYAKVRVQFGRPIGSFQAIKHKLAEMLTDVETARSACRWAAWIAAESPAELPAAASVAKSYGSEALFRCAAETIQIHGGVGFTWEHDAHLYFKRAKSSATLLGDPAFHRARIADHLGLSSSGLPGT